MAKEIKLTQGSEEWLAWRRNHITASNAAKLCGVSRFGDALSVYESMVEGKEVPDNYWMERGRELEPHARAYLNSRCDGKYFESCCFESEINPIFGCSLDCYDKYNGEIIEIKTTSPQKLELVMKNKEIEVDYIYQCNFQMMVMGYDEMNIFYYQDNSLNILIPIKRDEKICKEIEKNCLKFWNEHVVPKKKPKPKKEEPKTINDTNFFTKSSRYWALKREIDEKTKELGNLKMELFAIAGEDEVQDSNISIIKSNRASVSYKDIIKECDIPKEVIDAYTTKTITWSIRLKDIQK